MSLILLGRGPSWRECPFNDEVWACATCLLDSELADREYSKVFAFDMKGIPYLENALKIARARNIPIVSTREYATEPYPIREIAMEFQSSYFKNTMSYMIALAIYNGYKKFQIHGIDQGPAWNYGSGKPYITFWLGVATGRGVDCRMGRGSLRWQYHSGVGDAKPEPFECNDSNLIRIGGDSGAD